MEKKLYELKIDQDLQNLIPPLSDEERGMLEESILRDGCDTPLTVWNGVIVDGHNRYEICRTHDIPFAIEEKAFPDKDAAMFWMLEHQLARRNLNSYQRGELALKAKGFYAKLAQDRMLAGVNPGQNSAQGGRVSEKLAKMAGVSHDTIKKVQKIDAEADEETKAELRKGNMSIHKAYTALKDKEHEGETRVCERCGEEKPFSEFRIPSNGTDYKPICRSCESSQEEEPKPDGPAKGIEVRDGKLAHVFVGLPDDAGAFDQVVSMLKSAQNYYIAAFRTLIGQYSPHMICRENNVILWSMIENTADVIEEMFNNHIKEEQ